MEWGSPDLMFGKQKEATDRPPLATGPGGDPWDHKTLDWLKATSMLSLHITHIERRFKSGPSAPARDGEYSPEIIASGYLPHAPQHVHVQVEFNSCVREYGSAWLTYYLEQEHAAGKLNVPYLGINLSDQDGQIRTGVVESLRDAIAGGFSVAEARIWTKFSDGWDDARGGHSRSFDVDGMIVWAYSRSPRLQSWALPLGEFDLNTHPDHRQLRRKPQE